MLASSAHVQLFGLCDRRPTKSGRDARAPSVREARSRRSKGERERRMKKSYHSARQNGLDGLPVRPQPKGIYPKGERAGARPRSH